VIDERRERIKDVLHQAMHLAGDDRSRFVGEACSSDDSMRAEIESLLAALGDAPSDFLHIGTEIDPVALLDQGQIFEQRFRLIRKLGEGGMGQVWLAEQTAPVKRQVALKLIRAGMYDAAVLQRFHAERQSLAIMDHPYIAKVFDAGTTALGQPYFVMEYVPGLALTDYCDTHKLGVAQRLNLFIHACEGVQHAHQKAIIHRDLKPANILVVEVDGAPTPRIIDFGLAKPAAPQLDDETRYTQIGQFIGTPGYMSPEQVNPAISDIDTRTDVYSLGVILCVLLTGLQPFETKRRERPPLHEWLRQIREEDPPSLTKKINADRESIAAVADNRSTDVKQLVHALRGDLEAITLKALEREREHRYATPSELAADIRRHLNDEAIVARPASAVYQMRKFIRRHRIAAAVASLIAILAVVTSAAGLIAVRKQHEAEYQKRQAEYQTRQALQAQSRLLTEVAAQRLKESDIAGARGIVLDVLTNAEYQQGYSPAAISVFQDIRAADRQLALLSGHGDRVFTAAFSPDGATIVTASADKTARIWDARTGAEIAVLLGHSDRVFDAAFSPDGTRIVTASRDKTARIWDARSGAPLLVLTGHGDRVTSAAYSPDGKRIVTASWDKIARVWDAQTGAPIRDLSGHSDVLYRAVYSPDGKRIATASQDKTARIWDAATGKQLAALIGHGDYVASVDYSPDGMQLVTASADKTARTWDAHSAVQLAVLAGHGDVVYSAAYSPDGRHIVTASWDKTARTWDARSGSQIGVFAGHGATVSSAAYAPGGSRIVTASQDKTARIWDARIGGQLGVLAGHAGAVNGAAFSPDGSHIVTGSEDKSARIWDVATDTPLVVLSGHSGAIASARFSPDGAHVVTASQDKTARTWDARTGAQDALLSGHIDRIYTAAYSPDGTRIVTASRDKTARIWDADTGADITQLLGHADRVYSAAYSSDGSRVVTASRDRTMRIWDARSGAQLIVLSGHNDEVLTAEFSPDSARIVSASIDGTARVWDARSGKQLLVISGHGDRLLCAAYSRDGTRIVTGGDDRIARIWDAHSGVQLAALSGHDDLVDSAAFSPDGTRVVSASADRTARIWDARVPAGIEAQILWAAAAEPDPPGIERSQPAPVRNADSDGGAGAQAQRAERDEKSALTRTDAHGRNGLLLQAFAGYAAAAEQAHREHWPDDAWRYWRHRRASLARVLAQEDMMQEVADTYRAALSRPQAPLR
jgi:WD40 repeat protein/serine/threonine protein kinase